jgi:D-cysteine desulfhydrase
MRSGAERIRRVLAAYPSAGLSITPTPIHALERLSKPLGGNKVRKLDYLVGDALAREADTLLVANASSFSRNAAAAGRAHGLEVHILIAGDEAAHNVASRAFFAAMDARVHYIGEQGIEHAQHVLADTLRARGRHVVELHPGGSDTIGTLGYVEAFAEMAEFMAREGVMFDRIFHASGSAATQAGLVLGRELSGFVETDVVGVAVSQPTDVQTRRVSQLARATAAMLGLAFDASAVVVDDRYLGEGYPIPSLASCAAVDDFAKGEGILLDPIYAGKAAAALIGQAQGGELEDAENVLLIHTGGNAGMYY